jgi:hypothetical protein
MRRLLLSRSEPIRLAAFSSVRLQRTLLSIAAMLAMTAALAAPPYAGRPVQEVLEELRTHELNFIYNTQLVPRELTVRAEPKSGSGLAIAIEVLRQHELELLRVAPGTYAVVRGHARVQTPRTEHLPDTARPQIDEIVVSTSRYALASEHAAPSMLISQQEIDALPRLGDETLRAVQRLPGAAGNGVWGLAAIRGGEPGETLILLDGVQLFEPFHLKNFFSPVSLLDARMIAEMDVYSGGFNAQYGTRISAVVDAKSVRPRADRYYELGASVFHTSALASRRFADGKGQLLISGRRSNLDQVAEALNSDFGEPRYFDAFSRLDYEVSPGTRIFASYLGSRDKISARRTSRGERARSEYRNNYAWLGIERDWSDYASTRVIGSFTDVTNDRSGRIDQAGRIVGSVDDERAFHIASLQFDGTIEAGRFLNTWGLTAKQLSANYDYRSDVSFEADYPFIGSPAVDAHRAARLRPNGHEYAAYWSTRVQLLPQLTTELGLRWDDETYTDANSETQLSPRVSAMYLLPAGQRVRLSWGRFFQSQSINEALIENAARQFFPAQRADQVVLSYEADLRHGRQLRIEAYRKDYDRLRPRWENLFYPIVLVPELEYDRTLVDPDRARTEGIELLLSQRSGEEWTWWFGYTWSQAKDIIDGREVSRSWNQRHAVTAGVQWARGRWDITLADTYHTGWPITPFQLVGTGADARLEVGARNSVRLDDFNSLDVRVNRRIDLGRGELDVFLELSNLVNQSNACCIEPITTRNGQGEVLLDAERSYWLGIVPSIGVLWRY